MFRGPAPDAKGVEIAVLRHQLMVTQRQVAPAVGQRLTGAHRLSRTDRIVAAHTIIVIAAHFDVLAEAELSVDLSEAWLAAGDKLALSAGQAESEQLAQSVLRVAVGLPEPYSFRRE